MDISKPTEFAFRRTIRNLLCGGYGGYRLARLKVWDVVDGKKLANGREIHLDETK
jgi:hypothetical protein